MPEILRDGVRISYDVHGAGPALVLCNGYGVTREMWEPQVDHLADTYRVITWDMRGHGRSGSPEDLAAYTPAHTVGDLLAILEDCGADRAAIGGHSLGGYVALLFHLTHPERTAGLLLCATGPGYRNAQGRAGWNDLAERTAQALEAKGIDALRPGAALRRSRHGSTMGLILAARGLMLQTDSVVIDSLTDIKVPTLVVVGADDRSFVAPSKFMADLIPDASLTVIPNAGHDANNDQAAAFNEAVVGFLKTLAW